jgi:hypothetical protein
MSKNTTDSYIELRVNNRTVETIEALKDYCPESSNCTTEQEQQTSMSS